MIFSVADEKRRASERLAEELRRFLDQGGRVQWLPMGAHSGSDTTTPNAAQRKKASKRRRELSL